MADPEGGGGCVWVEPRTESKLFHFHGELWDNVGKMVKPPLQIRTPSPVILDPCQILGLKFLSEYRLILMFCFTFA